MKDDAVMCFARFDFWYTNFYKHHIFGNNIYELLSYVQTVSRDTVLSGVPRVAFYSIICE